MNDPMTVSTLTQASAHGIQIVIIVQKYFHFWFFTLDAWINDASDFRHSIVVIPNKDLQEGENQKINSSTVLFIQKPRVTLIGF